MKVVDAAAAIFAMLAIMLTVLAFLAVKGPAIEVHDLTIRANGLPRTDSNRDLLIQSQPSYH